MIDWKEDKRPAKNGWVPGDYMALCLSCRDRFIGAKRCITCADCAYTLSDPTPQPSVPFQVGDIVSFQRVFGGIDRASSRRFEMARRSCERATMNGMPGGCPLRS